MLSSWDGFRRWNISVRIDRYNAFWGLSSSGVECSSTLTLSFLGLAFLGKHGIVASSSGDNHGCIGVSTLNTLVKHDVLRIVLLCIGTIWVLETSFSLYNSWHGGKVSSTATLSIT